MNSPKKMRLLLTLLLTLSLTIVLMGCTNHLNNTSDKPMETAEKSGSSNISEPSEGTESPDATKSSDDADSVDKLLIVSSLFPHYDFARSIAGEYADVKLILPPGTESHSYEPTPKDIIEISESDLFLYTNALMEPWAQTLIETIDVQHTTVIDLSEGIMLLANNHSGSEEDGHVEGEYDPHYWLDPQNAMHMVIAIREALISKMPEKAEVFNANAQVLLDDLQALDEAFMDAFEKTDSKTILSGGHFAFGYFAKHYGLDNQSPYVGFSPDAEPTPQRISELIDTIENTGAKAIFYEELIDPRVAKIISSEADVEMLLLHGAHNISKKELADGVTYIEIMKGNLERLKIGLGYHE